MTENALNILVVDDDMMARMTAAQCVKQQGHIASMAEGGAKALEMLRSDKYDLVLLDLLMPEMDGFEVLETIKKDPEIQGIPIIMVSGSGDAETITKCKQRGAVGLLAKPLDPVELTVQISTCLT